VSRYSRQILFPGIGEDGQTRINASSAAIIGCGALGTLQAAALARAGVGRLVIVDRDYVELSNLQRQLLFTESDAADGVPKAVAAARELARANSSVTVEPQVADLTATNIEDLLEGVNVILDGTDNFETRYLINDFAVRNRIPWVYGGAVASYGITMPVMPGKACCFKCFYPEPPHGVQPTCDTAGVLNAVTSAVAAIQAGDAVKILVRGEAAARVTTIDVWTGRIRQSQLPPAVADCPTCGLGEYPHLSERRRTPISLCGRNAVQIHELDRPLDLEQLRAQLEPLGQVRANEFALRFFKPPYEMTFFPDGRAIIKGTQDVGLARSLYAKYVG